jgi:hypothetical protein
VDPVTGSVIVAAIAALASIGNAIINARGSAERLRADERERKYRAKITDLGGDPDDV